MSEKIWFENYFIAHRGLHNEEAPENTLPAFVNAIDNGYAIELDVQQISDGNIIVFHDNKLNRLTGKDGYTKNLKRDDLSTCFVLGTNNTIPLFSDVLKLVDGKVPLLIEIKNEYKVGDQEKAVLDILKDYKGEFAIQSFNPFVVQYIKKIEPNYTVGQLSSFFKKDKMSIIKKSFLKRLRFLKKFKTDFINYDAQYLPNQYVEKHKDLTLLAYTIRSQEEYDRISNICTSVVFEGFTPIKKQLNDENQKSES